MSKKFKLQNLTAKTVTSPPPIKPAQPIDNSHKKSKLQNEIDKLVNRIADTDQDIQQTAKLLDIDVFLKKQKEKRLQYAKDLNSDFQAQKKKREELLYNKYKREPKEETPSVATLLKGDVPLEIMKVLSMEASVFGSNVLSGHYHQTRQIEVEGGLEQKYLIREGNALRRVREVNSGPDAPIFPIEAVDNELQPSEEGENLMNALVLMKKQFSLRMYSQTARENTKTITCKMFMGGEPRMVVSADTIEVRQFAHKYVIAGSCCHSASLFWPSMMEKCLKKMIHPNKLMGMSLLESMHCAYGVDGEFITITNKNIIKNNLVAILKSLQTTALIGFLNGGRNNQIYANRVYPLEAIEDSQRKPELKARKAAKQSKVQELFEKDKPPENYFRVNNPYYGRTLQSDGNKRFSLTQILELFDTIVIIRNYPQKWKCFRIKADFFSNGSVAITNSDWTRNSQYSFTLSKSSYTRIVLRRRKYEISQENYGYLLFQTKDGETVINCMKLDTLIVKTKSNDPNEASCSLQLAKGTYVIVPYSSLISRECYVFFYLDVFVEKEEAISWNKSRQMDYLYISSQGNDEKVLNKLEWRDRMEKPKAELFQPNKVFQKDSAQNATLLGSLTLINNSKAEDYLIPGRLGCLLVNQQIEVPVQKSKSSKPINTEMQKWERDEALTVLLGYDVIQDDIGRIKEIIEETEDVVDMSGFQLGTEGVEAVIQGILSVRRIRELRLQRNLMDDECVTFLCYYLEKNNRVELRQLRLGGNSFGKLGRKALDGLHKKFPDLNISL